MPIVGQGVVIPKDLGFTPQKGMKDIYDSDDSMGADGKVSFYNDEGKLLFAAERKKQKWSVVNKDSEKDNQSFKNANTPDYRITIIGESGEIVIKGLKDDTCYTGNYKADSDMGAYCRGLSFRSNLLKCDREKKDLPLFEVNTIVSSVERNSDGTIRVNVPENPFMGSFIVKSDDFQFSEGQHICYTDSNPPNMLIGDGKKSTTIIQHYKMGWIGKKKYDYYQLNEASRSIYDELIQGADHNRLCSYLKDVEEIFKGIYTGKEPSFLSSKSEEYKEKATALAKEYDNISRKSILRKGEYCLIHPDDVRDSAIVQSAKDYVPSHILTSTSTSSEKKPKKIIPAFLSKIRGK